MRPILRALALTAISAIASGCVAARDPRDASTDGPWTLAAEPSLLIESRGDEPLFRVRDVALSDARVAVADGSDNVVAVYDRKGALLHVLGGSGGGPGEFEALSDVFLLPGDSVLAFDAGLRRLTVFSPTAQYVRGFSLRYADGSAATGAMVIGRLASGVLVAQQIRSPSVETGTSGVTRALMDIMRFTANGVLLDTLATVRGWEAFTGEVNGAVWGNTPIPFGHSTYIAAAGPVTVLALTDSSVLRLFDDGQRSARHVTLDLPPGPPVEASDISAFKERALGTAPEPMKTELTKLYDAMPFPKQQARFNWVYVGSDGSIWLRLPTSPNTDHRFRVLDQHGQPVGTAVLPTQFAVDEISLNDVAGVWTDSLGAESVRKFRISR